MKKLKLIGVVIVVLILVGLLFTSLRLGAVIKTAVERVGPKITGVDITLEDADFSILKGKAELTGLVVGNPEGFKTPSAFELGKMHIEINPASILSDKVEITKIEILDMVLTYEKKLKGSNLAKIQEQIEANTGGPKKESREKDDKKKEAADKKEAAPAKTVLIRELLVDGAKVNVGMVGQEMTLALADIKMENIGENSAATFADVIAVILGTITKSVVKVVTEPGALVGGTAGAVLKTVGSLTGSETIEGGAEKTAEAVEKIGEGVDKALNGLSGGLLKKASE